MGRGMSGFAFRLEAIQSSLEGMLQGAALPILSDLQLQVVGPHYLRLFPDPLPDVFVGQPLLVSGSYAGPWGEQVHLTGLLPSGEREWSSLGTTSMVCRLGQSVHFHSHWGWPRKVVREHKVLG